MIASVEAIFLSTFVLISQNRMAAAADTRADLDLQISLLAEHEITGMIRLVEEVAKRMGVKTEAHGDFGEITQDVAPEAVLDEIEASQAELRHRQCDPGVQATLLGLRRVLLPLQGEHLTAAGNKRVDGQSRPVLAWTATQPGGAPDIVTLRSARAP
jgi:hypothetical protein